MCVLLLDNGLLTVQCLLVVCSATITARLLFGALLVLTVLFTDLTKFPDSVTFKLRFAAPLALFRWRNGVNSLLPWLLGMFGLQLMMWTRMMEWNAEIVTWT